MQRTASGVWVPENPFVLALDESGNSGDNYYDLDQPLFVIGGWLLPQTLRKHAEAVIVDAVNQLQSRPIDLKGSRLLRSAPGQRLLASIVDELMRAGVIPCVTFYEKRFVVAGKFVETLVDPEWNDAAAAVSSADADQRIALAEALYGSIPSVEARRLWDAIRRPTPAELQDALDAYCSSLTGQVDPGVVGLLKGIYPRLEELVGVLQNVQEDELWRHPDAPARSVLPTLLTNIDELGEAIGASSVDVTHDETASFGAVLEDTFESLQGGGERSTVLLAGKRRMRIGYKVITSFGLRRSEDSRLIQAADVLACFTAACLKDVLVTGEPRSRFEESYRNLMLSGSYFNTLEWIAGEACWKKAFPPTLAYAMAKLSHEGPRLPDVPELKQGTFGIMAPTHIVRP